MLAMLSAIYIKRQLYLQLFLFFSKTNSIFTFILGKTNTRYTFASCNNMLTNVIKIASLKEYLP